LREELITPVLLGSAARENGALLPPPRRANTYTLSSTPPET